MSAACIPSLELRDYQIDLVDRAEAAFREEGVGAVVIASPTGSGKTLTAAEMIRRRVEHRQRVLFLAHLDTLLEDTHARLQRAGVWSGILQAGRPTDPLAPVQVCSIQTMHARGARPPADFLILDECHHALSPTQSALLDAYAGVPLLGLTPVPQRGDRAPLGDRFQRLVLGPTVGWLTAEGYLAPCDVIAPPAPIDGALAMDPVDAWFEHAPGARAIVFAKNVRHAEDIAARFNARGVTAECITGETNRPVRTAVRGRVTSGETRVLVSVAVFLEGFDLPSIEAVVLARPFGVTGSYLQAIGRGLRPSPCTGKRRCTVIDLCGAVYAHGLPDDAREWSLEGDAVRRTGAALDPMRRCIACMAIFRPAATCPRCGAVATSAPKLPRVLSRAERMERVNVLPLAERDRRYLAKLEWIARMRLCLALPAARQWAVRAFVKHHHREPGQEAA
jgi:DNA repair protein RadD